MAGKAERKHRFVKPEKVDINSVEGRQVLQKKA